MGHIYLNCRSRLDFSSLSLFGGVRVPSKACHSNSPTKFPVEVSNPWIFGSHFEDPKSWSLNPLFPCQRKIVFTPPKTNSGTPKWRFGTWFFFFKQVIFRFQPIVFGSSWLENAPFLLGPGNFSGVNSQTSIGCVMLRLSSRTLVK